MEFCIYVCVDVSVCVSCVFVSVHACVYVCCLCLLLVYSMLTCTCVCTHISVDVCVKKDIMFILCVLCVWCSRCTIHTQLILYYTTTLAGVYVCVCRPLRNRSFRYFTTHILGRPVRTEIDLKRPVTRVYILYSRYFSQKINFMINSIEFLGESLNISYCILIKLPIP